MKKLLIALLLFSNVGLAQSGMMMYSGSNISVPSTVYVPFAGGGSSAAQESSVASQVPVQAAISKLSVTVSPAPLAGSNILFTLRDNNSSSQLSCAVSGGQTGCSDTSHSITSSANDLLDWQIQPGGVVVGIQNVSITVQFRPSATEGLVFLCQVSTPVNSFTIGPCVFPPPPTGKQWIKLIEYSYVANYAGNDTVGDQYNGDTGANYKYECSSSSDGVNWALGNNATSTNVVKLASANTNQSRNITSVINNDINKAEKTVVSTPVTGTGSSSSQTVFETCNGSWAPGVGVSINSITQVTFIARMGANSGFAVFGIAW